jgi:hypothetical protein
MKWVMALRMHGPNTSANRSLRIGPDNGISHNAQFQILLHLFQEFANSCLLCATQILLSHISDYSQLIYKKATLHLRKCKALPFRQWVNPTLSGFGGPLMLRCPVGPTKSLWTSPLALCHLLALWIIDYSRQLMRQFLLCLFLSQLLSPVRLIRV